MDAYCPSPGDIIVFPGAPLTFNRTQRYVVTAFVCSRVFFMPEDRGEEFNYPISKLRDIGMAKVSDGAQPAVTAGKAG
jgi:hypothetical protein